MVLEYAVQSLKRAYAAGVKMGLGTDSLSTAETAMGNNAAELELYVQRGGLRPMQTIVCATKTNAEVLGLADKLGTLEAGKVADFLVLEADPLSDITVLRNKANIARVYKSGKQVPRLPVGV